MWPCSRSRWAQQLLPEPMSTLQVHAEVEERRCR